MLQVLIVLRQKAKKQNLKATLQAMAKDTGDISKLVWVFIAEPQHILICN